MRCVCGNSYYRDGTRFNKTTGVTMQRLRCKVCGKGCQVPVDEVLVENVRLAKQKQALQDKNWVEASNQMRSSAWAAQVKSRSERLAKLMEYGVWVE